MSRDDLNSIAWLADYGLRVWTMPRDNGIRSGERLSKERADKMTSALDTFERRIAPLLSETEEEKQRDEYRFFSSEDRMKRMWEYYE
jgi:hypothetical protein